MTDQQSVPGSGSDRAAAEQVTKQLESKFEQLRGIQSAMKLQLVVAVVAIVVVMLVFGASTYKTVSTNFEPQKITALAQERAIAMQPMVQQKLVTAALQAAPTYRQLAQERLPEVLPQVRDNAQKVVADLPQQVQDDLVNVLKQSAERVAVQVKGELSGTFPALADATRSEALLVSLQDAVDRETQTFLSSVNGMFEEEASRISDVLLRFDVPPSTGTDSIELQRQIVHHLLLLADHELMSDDGIAEQVITAKHQELPSSVEVE